jgi:hypothetical protein
VGDMAGDYVVGEIEKEVVSEILVGLERAF